MSTNYAGAPTLLGAAWRYKLIVLAAVVALVAAAVAYAEVRPAVYSATATMVLQDPHSDPVFATSTGQAPDRYTSDQIAVLKSPQLAAAAAAVGQSKNPPLGLSQSDFTAHTVVSGTPLNGNAVQITFTAADSNTALAGVDAVKTAYEQTVRDAVSGQLHTLLAQIDSELSSITSDLSRVAEQLTAAAGNQSLLQQQTALVARRDTLNAKRDQVVVDAASGSNGVALYLPPQSTTHSSKLVTSLPIIAVAGVLGLLLGVLLAYLVASRRRVFRSRVEPEMVLGAPLVADIPPFHRAYPLPVAEGEGAREALAAFRSAALFVEARHLTTSRDASRRHGVGGARRLLVVSALRGEGRSTVVANLGLALADSGVSTLLVDADPEVGGLSRLLTGRFAVERAAERSSPRSGGARAPEFDLSTTQSSATAMALEQVVRPGHSLVPFALLRAGFAPHALEDAERDKRMAELQAGFNVILIDAPPVAELGPYWPLARGADGALVVITPHTMAREVEELDRLLRALELPVAGYLYNRLPRAGRRPHISAAVPNEAAPPPPDQAVSAA